MFSTAGPHRIRLVPMLVALMVLLAACGGGGDDGDDGSAPDAQETETTSEETDDSGEPAEPAEELVTSGEPVLFEAASGVELTVPVGDDGSCPVPDTSFDDQEDFVALCAGHFSGAGGDFLVV